MVAAVFSNAHQLASFPLDSLLRCGEGSKLGECPRESGGTGNIVLISKPAELSKRRLQPQVLQKHLRRRVIIDGFGKECTDYRPTV